MESMNGIRQTGHHTKFQGNVIYLFRVYCIVRFPRAHKGTVVTAERAGIAAIDRHIGGQQVRQALAFERRIDETDFLSVLEW